jgi:V/A-type H+/Na+-transporting ATPase subunit I
MRTERMKKVELLVMRTDAASVLRYLGGASCIQLSPESRQSLEPGVDEAGAAVLAEKLQALARFLGVHESPQTTVPAGDRAETLSAARRLVDSSREILEAEAALLKKKLSVSQSLRELESFASLRVPLSTIASLSHFVCRVGTVDPSAQDGLAKVLDKRAVLVPLGQPGLVMALGVKKARWAVDTELRKAGFQETALPAGVQGAPADVVETLKAELVQAQSDLAALEARKAELRKTSEGEIRAVLAALDVDARIDAVRQGLPGTGSLQLITGWVPARLFPSVASELERITEGRLAARSFDPPEVMDVTAGKTRVPVDFRQGPVVGSFRRMVFSYGVPLYGVIDPTPFVAVMFVLLFAIMFGDVGQGLVGVIFGLLISSGRIRAFEAWRRKRFGTVFLLAGAASMLSGLLYGSFFANERVLIPVLRWLTGSILGTPMDRIISLEGTTRILTFFGITIGIGAIINSVGLVMNMVNLARQGNWQRAILHKTGAAGAVFFWYALSLGVRILLGGKFQTWDLAVLGVPLLALFFREPIIHLVTGKRPLLSEGILGFVMEGIVEILESATYYMSNSVSFLRVAAFGLAHTVLSLIVFSLAGMVSHSAAGPVFQALIILIGNLIIIVLEGLIVTIQVVRLQYYEFFSKFFTETGEEFRPFTLTASEVKQ